MNVLTVRTALAAFLGSPRSWTTFEKNWLAVFSAVIVGVFFITDDTPVALIASITGMLSVVLTAKGLLGSYPFGLINVVLYGWIAYEYGLYGETMLNWIYYAPLQIVGLWLWARRTRRDTADERTRVVLARSLTARQMIFVVTGAAVAIAAYAGLLAVIGGKAVGLDSATTVLSVLGMALMIMRFREQWALWIVVDVISIIMWVVVLADGGTAWAMVVMWTAYLVNAVYGYLRWSRMIAVQQEVPEVTSGVIAGDVAEEVTVP